MKTLALILAMFLGLGIAANAQMYSIYDLDVDLFPETKRHIVYTEFMGIGGYASINYMPALVVDPNGIFAIRARVGIGVTEEAVHFPHGLIFTIGNVNHQLELGFQGTVVEDYGIGDKLDFLYGNEPGTRYVYSFFGCD